MKRRLLPKYIWILIAMYFIASLAHFVHNAEFIAYYPNMPTWLTRDTVYVAWLIITSIGFIALVMLRLGLHAIGIALISVYGAFGLDGLLHYTLALCSQHTLVTNITIWSEAISGFVLMLAAALILSRRVVDMRN